MVGILNKNISWTDFCLPVELRHCVAINIYDTAPLICINYLKIRIFFEAYIFLSSCIYNNSYEIILLQRSQVLIIQWLAILVNRRWGKLWRNTSVRQLQTYFKLEKCGCLHWYFARRIEQILLGFFSDSHSLEVSFQ